MPPVVPGMTRVVQAAGRLIRSARDTGIIALFDRRFLYTLTATTCPPTGYRRAAWESWWASRPGRRRSFFG